MKEILHRDSKSSKDMKLNKNGLNYYKHLLHWDLMIIFTTKVAFLKCLILTCFLSWKFKKVNLDRMVSGKREIANEKSAL